MAKEVIVLIDDEDKLRQLLARILELEGYKVHQAPNAHKGLELLEQHQNTHLVISDVKLPDDNGIHLLEKIKAKYPLVEVVVITAYGTIGDGVKAMKLGAFDYITKGDQDEQMLVTVERAVEKAKMQRRILELGKSVEAKYSFDSILGTSPAIKEAIHLAKKVAPADSTVLLEGETGVGKELFAQAIHNASLRKNKSFVAINCSAFPKDLLESQMFGHKKGAFTGASFDKKGFFEEAHHGTLFLDEIGEMNLELQAKLLRVLETGSFIKLGETKPTQADVRIIAATNRDLLKESQQEHFRLDLFYRLAAFRIQIPSLRERAMDITPLATYFMQLYAAKSNKRIHQMEDSFLQKLQIYPWKGNIRELKNIIERAVILADTDTLTADLLPAEVRIFTPSMDIIPHESASLEQIEKEHIRKILTLTHGNKTEAARQLGIGLTTLYRKIAEYNLE
ncbi:sigma-54 dependent transcriptional regulator [Rhodocytophaga aerolata]|uniref:Sigma-54 dependent transcriptional regulator n=1 Tax=Rhodocytophaga aerolata TaxID=455078 RepID=A0ABT8RJ76_9BACT|nr:sigma-54 dependent transcriptional regulator [Rhodocytophaga aerolata]MDO1451464.1 sigma-54 dependent transcriptional regulator [Rhodocytophaga aerolata]